MEQYDLRVDDYIYRSAGFAQPILTHVRELVHEAEPNIGETIKWGFPFFDHDGPICHMAAFKQHCAFGLWKVGQLDDPYQVINKSDQSSAGSFGRICTLYDLPADKILIKYIQAAVELNIKKNANKAVPKLKMSPLKGILNIPDDLIGMFDQHQEAAAFFYDAAYSVKKDYLEWFAEAKTETTRRKRLQTALEWMAEGKSRHWKYK